MNNRAYTVTVVQVEAQPIAAARARTAARNIPARFKQPLDKVWKFLRQHPKLRAGGQNVFLYRHDVDSAGAMTIDFGVQVVSPFEADGDVFCAMTPAGEVATTTHYGPYAGLGSAHEAIHAWMKKNGRLDGGWSWEIYGDWNDNPEKLETRILYLLR
ncbi:MAG TPA: GyrI-like domain-containing protein [Xanthobacteraceae bacterium]|jgi:effector-binding domain-containing protein